MIFVIPKDDPVETSSNLECEAVNITLTCVVFPNIRSYIDGILLMSFLSSLYELFGI